MSEYINIQAKVLRKMSGLEEWLEIDIASLSSLPSQEIIIEKVINLSDEQYEDFISCFFTYRQYIT